MNLNNMLQIPSPTKISIITRLRGVNPKKLNEQNISLSLMNPQYTIFTQKNSSPLDKLYVSERPLDSSQINSILNSKDHSLNYFNYDKVYPESCSLDLIYQQVLQNPINDLFYKKNSCMLFFGPTLGGKSYLLRGSPYKNDNEAGLLTRAIKEIFQRIEFNKNFCVKISVYQVYLNKIYDLLSEDNANELNIDSKFGDLNNSYNINILGLTKKEIKNSNEYDLILREAINIRKNLSQILGAVDMKKTSHFIISLYLENKSENCLFPFSQFDFVELISSNYGLIKENDKSISIESNLFKNTNNEFNSIADNLINISQGSLPNKTTILSLSLKNTLKPGSNIILVNCVIPWEFPVDSSYNSLKFANSIFNNVCKCDNNSIYFNNLNNTSINNNLTLEFSNTNSCNHLLKNLNSNQNNLININNSSYEKMSEYLNSLTIDKLEYLFPEKESQKNKNNNKDLNKINKNIFNKYKIDENENNIPKQNKASLINKSFDSKKDNINKTKNKNNKINTKRNNSKKKKYNKNLSYNNYENHENLSPKERKLIKLNKALKELEERNNELNKKSIPEYLYTTTSTIQNINNKSNLNLEGDLNNTELIEDNNISPNIQFDKIKEEYSDLKINNIILKEDINRLEEANKNLEESLQEERNTNIEVLNKNVELSNRLLKLESLLEEAGLREEKYKINEINIEKLLNEKLYLNSKIVEDEKEYKRMKDERENFEVEYKVLVTKYNELKNDYDLMHNDYCSIKMEHEDQFRKIEDKVDNLMKEIEKLQNENNMLRNENERRKIELNGIGNERDDYLDKYNEEKHKNDLLNNKIEEIENEFNKFKKEKMNGDYFKMKNEQSKKDKYERKMQIVNDLQERILKYKQQRLKTGNDD